MADVPPPSANELARQLQSSLRRQRYRPQLITLLVLGLSFVALLTLAWSLYHPTEVVPYQVIAQDSIMTQGENVRLRGILIDSEGKPARGRRESVLFQEEMIVPGGETMMLEATSERTGTVEVQHKLPQEVNCVIYTVRLRGSVDRGRTYVWPKEAKVALVEVEKLLEAVPANWLQIIPANLKFKAELVSELRDREKNGWHLVYWVSTPGLQSLRPRAALRFRFETEELPAGPILDWLHFPEVESKQSLGERIEQELRQRFPGEFQRF